MVELLGIKTDVKSKHVPKNLRKNTDPNNESFSYPLP